MRKLSLVIAFLGLASTAHAGWFFGNNKNVLKDETIDTTVVLTNFNLRADSGKVLSFLTEAANDAENLKYLPAEKGADQALCGKDLNYDLFYKLINVTIHLADNAIDGVPFALSAEDVVVIERTPRCEPYMERLTSIAGLLASANGPDSENMTKVSLDLDTQILAFSMASGEKASFKVNSLPSRIKEIGDLTEMTVTAEGSGQNLGVRIKFDNFRPDDTPTHDYRRETCTIEHTERVCDRRGENCRYETVVEYGYRHISSSTTFDMTGYSLEFVDSANQTVFRGFITDGEFNTDENTSPCIPYGGRRPGRGW